jgi:hypothetical protein
MDIEEVRFKRQQLTKLIMSEVVKFYNETGVTISSISYECIDVIEMSGNRHPGMSHCQVELRL